MTSPASKKQMDLAHRALRWRWLLLDEFSVVSAELLARLEMKCRDVARDACTREVLQWQLRTATVRWIERPLVWRSMAIGPAKRNLSRHPAYSSTRITRRRTHSARTDNCVWSVAGVGWSEARRARTCEKTSDAWLQEVQAQVRVGNLSADMRAVLHGEPTTVPGSWLRGDVGCGNPACRALTDTCCPRKIQENECGVCANERETRRRVARGPADDACRLHAV